MNFQQISGEAELSKLMMSAAERCRDTVELMEMILLALPLRDLLLVRQVSREFRDLIEQSTPLRDIRATPLVMAKLDLPATCSISSPTRTTLTVDLELRFDRPVTVRRTASPLDGPRNLTHRFERGTPAPQAIRPYSVGAKFRGKALALSQENDTKYLTLTPGTPYRLSLDFGPYRRAPGLEHLALPNAGLNNLEPGKTYVLGVEPGLTLPAWVGTKRSLLAKVDAGVSLEPFRFHVMYGHTITYPGAVGRALPLVGEETILFDVVP